MDDDILIEREEALNEIVEKLNSHEDPRINRQKKHSLGEIFFLILCAQICNYSSLREYVYYGELKIQLLKNFFEYKHGIPSKSTISRVLAIFNPKLMETTLMEWAQSIRSKNTTEKNVLAIDGKTSCGVQGDTKLHMVNVYDTNVGLCLGQEKVDEKSNEITAIPKLLDTLNIKKQIISIDAMGCQKEIAKKIISKGGDYFLALKGNQGDLFSSVKDHFNDKDFLKNCSTFTSHDKGHGRVETRISHASSDIKWIDKNWEWPSLKSIVAIKSKRFSKGKETNETRYFITSLEPNAKRLLAISRAHWGIENSLNWVLDVIFGEDDRIIWNKNFAQNESTIRRIALNLIKQYREVHPLNKKHEKIAIKTLRKGLLIDDEGIKSLFKSKI